MDALVLRVADELDRLDMEQANGQVSAVPDGRTLRYYGSLGLLDPPTEIRGRRAYYGLRHVRQAVAVKALQAQGLALQEVQQRLTGRSDAELDAIIGRPSAPRFWLEAPAPTAPAPGLAGAEPTGTERTGAAGSTPGSHSPDFDGAAVGRTDPSTSQGAGHSEADDPLAIRLTPEVVVLIDLSSTPTSTDHEAIRAAGGSLVHELRRRGLVPDPEEQQ